ncbi:MAG: transglutaminase-like domain-containing protein [Halobacteriota archaeon]
MAQMIEMNEQGLPSQEARKSAGLALGPIIRKTLANPGALKRMRVMDPDEERYVRPPRPYDLPEYREGMKYCKSNEKYLRPTRYCNPREPLVIALANELGAYELSDWEFAEAAFWFVKTKFTAEFMSLNSVSDSLRRGTGTCMHMNSVWVALCRAAGIKARYKTFTMMLPDEFTSLATARGGNKAMAVNMINRGLPEVEGEICIDGSWTVGHVAMRPEYLARGYLPISRFGEDAIGLTFPLAPGATIKRYEGIPLWMSLAVRATVSFVPGAMERANLVILRVLSKGSTIIEKAGGLEAYDRAARNKSERIPEDEIVRTMKAAMRPELVEFEE